MNILKNQRKNLVDDTDIIDINDIEIGFVYKISEDGHPAIRKLLFKRKVQDDQLFDEGIDLCEKLNGKNLIYPIIEGTLSSSIFHEIGINDGDLIISATSKVGDVLKYLGFPSKLKNEELKYVKSTLLDEGSSIIPNGIEIDTDNFEKRENEKPTNIRGILRFYKYDSNMHLITDYEKKYFGNQSKQKIYKSHK